LDDHWTPAVKVREIALFPCVSTCPQAC